MKTKDDKKKTANQPRGIRNNNPLNIRRTRKKWIGEVDYINVYDSNFTATRWYDRAFCQFATMEQGYRAAFLLIRTYMQKYGLRTIEGIIKRWAPPYENDTEFYIQRVCNYSLIARDTPLCFGEKHTMMNLVGAMQAVECGNKYWPFDNKEMCEAMSNAYELASHA